MVLSVPILFYTLTLDLFSSNHGIFILPSSRDLRHGSLAVTLVTGTGGNSEIVKMQSSGEDPWGNWDLVSSARQAEGL